MSDLKVQGRLCEVFPEEAKTDSFRSRNFVIETDGQYPQFVQFQLVQDRCGIVDSHRIGDLVTVHFDLRGKKWNEKYITNLNAWKIEGDGTPQPTRMPSPNAVGNTAEATKEEPETAHFEMPTISVPTRTAHFEMPTVSNTDPIKTNVTANDEKPFNDLPF